MALVVLVLLVLLGALYAKTMGNDSDSGSMRAPYSSAPTVALAPVTVDGG